MTGPASSEPAIEVEHLSKRFEIQQERRYSLKERFVRGRPKGVREFWALRDVSFQVPKGSFFGIVGHNGSGKSTALKVLAGIYRPTEGSVAVRGRLRALLELGAGFHPELTGRENIQLNASILGLSQREIRASMDEIIEFAGIGDFIDAPVKVYSSGMTVRLGFSVAVKMDPEVLIVDEVIAVGDEEFQRKCLDHLLDLRRHGTTIVLVTHSMPTVEELCDEAIWLDHGVVKGAGGADQVVAQYLQMVNQAEAAQVATESESQLASGMPRRGEGPVRVEQLRLLANGVPTDSLLTGQPGTVELSLTNHDDPVECEVSFTVASESGTQLTSPPAFRIHVPTGDARVQFAMPAVTIQPGSYRVSTDVTRLGQLLDGLDDSFTIKVRQSGTPSVRGSLVLPGTWQEDDVSIG